MQLTYGYHASSELLEVSTPMLTRLRDLTDWSTHLGVLDGQYVMYLLRFAATSGLSSLVHVGSRLPAAATSMGRLMLCPKSEPAIRRLYKDSPTEAVQKILDFRRQDLKSDLIVSIGNFESGLCSVAAPIFDISGEMIGAISTTRMTDTVPDSILVQTRTAASQISRALGAR
ncbi:IclR family transcriptional regulator [Parasulfitobacter algicola]|uniref:IclR family transcriptional regulator n=1 Tax=Parasulfitobacter algicola TaxID=2614809 RepID=A0ABX2IS96_9RHOB|nr:IclR family transcriptional regulator C-terminal domain-containing protein [Sulfitobacter algicola]NSX55410.1 IclR family transcriptional regulator [Sulfitobacter algicola]